MVLINDTFNLFALSLAFTLIGLNVYLSTKILNITDLTCDASVTIGGCAYGTIVLCGVNPLIAFFISMCLGAFAGFMTSFFVTHIRIESVLASIISLTAIQTFILKIASAGKATMINGARSPFGTLSATNNLVIAIVVVTIFCVIFYKVLSSEYGLGMRVYGDGKIISESLGINSNRVLWVGLGMGNALSAIAGALIVQVSGGFSVGMGSGSLVFGLAAVIIGEKIINPKNIRGAIFGCFIGALIYKTVMGLITFGGEEATLLGAEYNSLLTAAVLVCLMALIQDKYKKGTLENV